MRTDVLILGAGPAGCAVAIPLARAGRRVLMVDALETPAAVIGESLLPFGSRVLELMGVSMEGFQRKDGAVFTRGADSVRFAFAESARPTWGHAWQVPRDDFDARVRARAFQAGAELKVARATRYEVATRTLHTDQGPILCEQFVDAAGRRKFLARQLGEVELHPRLRNAALHTQFRSVRRLEPEQVGDITICAWSGGWFWFIPFADGRTSVGLVLTPGHGLKGDRWQEALQSCPEAAARLEGAEQLGKLGGVSDFTAYSRRFSGEGWALAGDAAMFLDPVFSSGVLGALESGWTLGEALRDGADLQAWERSLRAAMVPMEQSVLAFYDGSFLDVACAPAAVQKKRFRKAIISLLAGDLFAPGNDASRRMAGKFGWLADLASKAPR